MANVSQDLLDSLRAMPEVLDALLEGCTQEQASAARGGDEGWSVVEVVCHLRDAEERALERMRLMRDNDNPVIPAYDQDTWARERNYAAANLRAAHRRTGAALAAAVGAARSARGTGRNYH